MDNWILKQTIDLSNMEKIVRVWPEALLVAGDGLAHTWQVTVLNAGEPADLEGASVTAYFNRSDHKSVLATGTVEGNVISVDFPATAYAVAGAMYGILRITQTGGKVVTLSALRFMVMIGPYSETIDPGTVIPSIDDLLAEIAAMQEATADATSAAASATAAANAGVRTDQVQNLTDAQKLMGRTNIDAAEQTQIQRVMTERGGVDVLAFGNLNSNTSNGVTFTRNSDGTWTVTDTATATLAIHNFYYNLTVLPAWLIPGKTYPVKFETTAATPGNVRLQVWFYKNGVYMGDDVSKSFTASGAITVPSDAGGAIVRLVVNNGVTANETVTVGIYSAMSNAELEAELEAAQEDLDSRVGDLEEASDDIECLKVTYPLKQTFNGLSYERASNSTIKLWGTMTVGSRRLLIFNGQNTTRTASGTFSETLEAGVYDISIKASGPVLQSETNFALAYAYTTYADAHTAVNRNIPEAEVELEYPAMLGLTVAQNVDYGTEENPSTITVSAKRKTAIDRKARNDISGIKSGLGVERITEWVEDNYVVLNTATADPSAPVSSTNYRYALVSCSSGEYFTVSGSGGTGPRLWAFIDSSYNVLTRSNYDVTEENVVIQAPPGATWLVINDRDKMSDSYRGIAVQPALERALPAIDALEATCEGVEGAATVTESLEGTSNGITYYFDDVERASVAIYGTATADTFLLCLNGQSAVKTSSGAFAKTFEAGAYELEVDATGDTGTIGDLSWVYTYDTFTSKETAIVISDFRKEVVFDGPAMLGLYIPSGFDFGDEYSPTKLYFSASRKTAVDTVARAGVEKAMAPSTGTLTDANNAEDNRVYEITSGNVANLPISGANGLLTSFSNGSAKMQFFSNSGSELYYRRLWNGIWSAWFQFAVRAVD